MVAVIVLTLFLILICAGVPMIISLSVATIAGFFYVGFNSLSQLYVFPQQLLEGIESPNLLALPFFVLVGSLMNVIGVTDRIFRIARALVGHMRAGLAQVNVIGSLFFGGITGSAIADCAGIGRLVIRSMTDRGYPAPFACALTAAASVIGPTMWPSVPLLIYAFSASVSVGRIFLAGIGPGILIVISLMLYNRFIATRYDVPLEPRAPASEVVSASLDGLAAMAAPLIIVGSILTGLATTMEAGVVACGYTIVLGIIYRKLTVRAFMDALSESVVLTSVIMMIIGVSVVMSWLVTIEQVPQQLAQAVLQTTDNKWIFLGIVVVFFLFIGAFLEPIPAMVILLPILLPLVDHFQIDRVHFGLITVYGLLLGIVTPPVGVALFVVTKVSGVSFERICVAVLPFHIPLTIVLFIITFVPDTVMWIPNLILGPAK